MRKMDKTSQAAEVAAVMQAQGGGDRSTVFESVGNDDRYMKAKFICVHCGRVAKVVKIKTDEPTVVKNIRCRNCPVAGYDWAYKPMEVGGNYVYITSCASVSAADMPRMKKFNERNVLTNK